MQEFAEHFGAPITTVSRAVLKAERAVLAATPFTAAMPPGPDVFFDNDISLKSLRCSVLKLALAFITVGFFVSE